MRIDLNKIKVTPKNLPFGFCVYGELSEEIGEWCNYWNFKTEISGKYTNILLNDNTNIFDIFEESKIYEYIDGFSPNLNRDGLHLGHLSNLIIAKSLQSLKISNKTIAILGDTLGGDTDSNLKQYNEYCKQFGYHIDNVYFASEQKGIEISSDNSGYIFGKTAGPLFQEGEGDYKGTMVFNITDDNKIVGIKSDGSTSYFYQDVSLACKLNAPTLYLTGTEQITHFNSLKLIFPHINHIGLGLVLTDGKKQSSSAGNVIFMEELLELVKTKFNNDSKLAWNILAGFILKYDLPSTKDIKLKDIDNVKLSHGLYLSYTLARLKSAGMVVNEIDNFNSKTLQFKLLRAKVMVSPNILFEELIEHCRNINKLYIDHHIKDNIENQEMFQPMLNDLVFGMKKIGLFPVDKV